MDPRPRLIAALLVFCAAAAGILTAIALSSNDDPPAQPGSPFEGSLLPPNVPAPDFDLRNQDGERVRMRDLRGKPAVVTFLYTTCEDTCPTEAHQIKGALDQLDADVPALAIAVNPPDDTPVRARRFLSEQRMTGRMDFVLGSRRELSPVWNGFFITPQSEEQEHMARMVLIDKRGNQRVGYPGQEATPERLAHDLKILLAE